MKKITFALLIFCAVACGPGECIDLDTGVETELQNGDLVCIDGDEFEFFADDARCECGAVCVWEGEFRLSFHNTEGVNIYTYRQVDTTSNETPPFADSFRMISFTGNQDCGEPNKVDDVVFTVRID